MASDPPSLSLTLADIQVAEAADDSLHRKRVQGILESALAAALKRQLEGNMSMPEWDRMEQAIASVEESTPLTVATISKLIGSTVDPAKVAAGAQRLETVAKAMLDAVASLNGAPKA